MISQAQFFQAIDHLMTRPKDALSQQVILDYVRENSDKPELLNASAPRSKHTALTIAVLYGLYPIIEEIIKIPHTINARNGEGRLPLTYATSCVKPYRPRVLDMLLNSKEIEINKPDTDLWKMTALFYAIFSRNEMAVTTLLNHGARLTFDDITPFEALNERVRYALNDQVSCDINRKIFSILGEARKKEKLSSSEKETKHTNGFSFIVTEEEFLNIIKLICKNDALSSRDLVICEMLIKNYIRNYIDANKNEDELFNILFEANVTLLKMHPLYKEAGDLIYRQLKFLLDYSFMHTCEEGRVPSCLKVPDTSASAVVGIEVSDSDEEVKPSSVKQVSDDPYHVGVDYIEKPESAKQVLDDPYHVGLDYEESSEDEEEENSYRSDDEDTPYDGDDEEESYLVTFSFLSRSNSASDRIAPAFDAKQEQTDNNTESSLSAKSRY